MKENDTNSFFPIFSVRKSDRIVISEIVSSKNFILTKNFTAILFQKTEDISLLANNYAQNLD